MIRFRWLGSGLRRCIAAGLAASWLPMAAVAAPREPVGLEPVSADVDEARPRPAGGLASLVAPGAEPALRQALKEATWPQDMVRLADAYLALHAQQPWAGDAAEIRHRAEVTARLLRRDDVQLFRSAFERARARGELQDDLRLAALGDAGAAYRLARQADGSGGSASAQVGWLQLASELGSDQAAYALALHFRRQQQPLIASLYETRAQELGYQTLPSLDHSRK